MGTKMSAFIYVTRSINVSITGPHSFRLHGVIVLDNVHNCPASQHIIFPYLHSL